MTAHSTLTPLVHALNDGETEWQQYLAHIERVGARPMTPAEVRLSLMADQLARQNAALAVAKIARTLNRPTHSDEQYNPTVALSQDHRTPAHVRERRQA